MQNQIRMTPVDMVIEQELKLTKVETPEEAKDVIIAAAQILGCSRARQFELAHVWAKTIN